MAYNICGKTALDDVKPGQLLSHLGTNPTTSASCYQHHNSHKHWHGDWTLEADLGRIVPNIGNFKAAFYGQEKKIDLKNKAEMEEIAAAVKGSPFAVASVKRQDKSRNPAPTFITSTLQQ